MALQEVSFRNEGVKTLRVYFEYRLYLKSEGTASGGVGLMVRCELAKSTLNVRRINTRIVSVDLVLCGKVVTIISVYNPKVVKVKKIKTVSMTI